jgi:hypothetical protein
VISPTLIARVDARRDTSGGPDACWPQVSGGRFMTYDGRRSVSTTVRRCVWLLEHGELPALCQHLEVSCGNAKCLNPKHIYYQTEEQRFWSHVDKSGGPRACWLWTAARVKRGYGVFHLNKKSDGSVVATRQAWLYTNREALPAEVFLCHHCDNPPCVNPDHLFKGSAKDNNDDMWRKGRGSCGPKHSEIMKRARARSGPSGGVDR